MKEHLHESFRRDAVLSIHERKKRVKIKIILIMAITVFSYNKNFHSFGAGVNRWIYSIEEMRKETKNTKILINCT
jgi:hypothetical protein